MKPHETTSEDSKPAPRSGTLSRRDFLTTSAVAGVALAVSGCHTAMKYDQGSGIIDIHQHLGYSGRSDEAFLAHQRAMGISKTILMPAGRSMKTASTHDGVSNGLQAKALGNEICYQFARAHPKEYLFAANEVPDAEGAIAEIEKYLKLGAVGIGEQKFGLECDSPEMQRIYELAAEYRVPVLMHWQFKMYNYGFERFPAMLRKYPKTMFIGHAQTWWANVDRDHLNQADLYPKTKVTPGGLTDQYLRDFPNMFGDLSAGSGLNALTRDEDRATEFLIRHQDKLLFGSDCSDWDGFGEKCSGAQTIATVRRLVPDKKVQKKLFRANAERVFRI